MNAVFSVVSLLVSFWLTMALSPKTVPAAQPPVAVIELFTSEGCSSCPAADKLLTETVQQANRQKQPIYALAFHVDYWNRLGWRDRFSDRRFSDRQRQYAKQFGSRSVYTPQMVLNGDQEFVGSNRARLQTVLVAALERPASVGITLKANRVGEKVSVKYGLTGQPTGSIVNIAIVNKNTNTKVERGENAGRQLVHTNVVRAFETVPAASAGTVQLQLPDDFVGGNSAVIAYVQHGQTKHTLGAAQISL